MDLLSFWFYTEVTGSEFCLETELRLLRESAWGTSSGATATVFGRGSKDCGASWNETSHCNSLAAGCLLLANFWRRHLATVSADSCEEFLASTEELPSVDTRVVVDVQNSLLYCWNCLSDELISSQSWLSSSSLSKADSKTESKLWSETSEICQEDIQGTAFKTHGPCSFKFINKIKQGCYVAVLWLWQ